MGPKLPNQARPKPVVEETPQPAGDDNNDEIPAPSTIKKPSKLDNDSDDDLFPTKKPANNNIKDISVRNSCDLIFPLNSNHPSIFLVSNFDTGSFT